MQKSFPFLSKILSLTWFVCIQPFLECNTNFQIYSPCSRIRLINRHSSRILT
uniref:Uncharacterized protein n=1 Tax=Rhizophora mucronata TaxID=61149 RepID=A0A2P2PAI0_RHIMU